MKTTNAAGIKVKSAIKAAGIGMPGMNHNRAGLKIKTAIKAAGIGMPGMNHNRAGLKVKSDIKGGTSMSPNHTARLLAI